WWGKKVAEADGSAIAAMPGYTAPSYNDNYVSLAAWSHHDSWNLANTHDPSVVYFDGYYYEWGTDASYGNAHLDAASGRHFPGKRSRNLVDWEYVPGPFNSTPQWAADTLNSIRKRMGLKSIAKD
nr:arabinan endo-1,5-alpha-L-arabinosidase [Bacteroidales bacterium]